MSIDNYLLIPGSLQFIGICANTFTFRIINMIQTSNNYNIVSALFAGTENIICMKILNTTLKGKKRRFRFRSKRFVSCPGHIFADHLAGFTMD